MTEHKFDNFSQYFNKWQKNLINFSIKRNLANKEIENYIRSFQNIDSEIYKSLFTAKEFYNNKKRYYNQKIKKLKQKDFEFRNLLNYAYKERKNVSEPKIRDEILTSITHINDSIEEIDQKIYTLNIEIEEQALDIEEENFIIEEIKNFDRDKQINLRHLRKLEDNLTSEMQSNSYFKIIRTIEILELNLKWIPRNLKKWSKKKVKVHKQMLKLYRKAKEYENIKKQIEKELLGAMQTTDKNLQLFYELKDKSQKKVLQEQVKLFKSKAKDREIRTLKTKYIIKKKRTQKKYSKKKLAIALEKQKSGKKLDFYELKLILEHSKQKK
ncbi:MAG: hypothetical protein ACXABG_06540 [Promethearchaeota archaeon]|jgi:hypothetical protein